jgi:septum formation topological specificity factor MinE
MRRELYENGELIETTTEQDSQADIKFRESLARLRTAYRFQGTPTNDQLATVLKDLMYVLRHYVKIDEDAE